MLAQFENVFEEADKFTEEYLTKELQLFDPDQHDEDEIKERAGDEGTKFLCLLNTLHDQTRLSVIAGMYHEWDKSMGSYRVNSLAL